MGVQGERWCVAFLSSDPGLAWLRPRSVIAARSAASRRSIVAGEIATDTPSCRKVITVRVHALG